MNVFQKNVKELSMANNNFGRCELTELNWIFFGFSPRGLL